MDKTNRQVDFQVINYDTSHLDHINGSVADYEYDLEEKQLPEIVKRNNFVLAADTRKAGGELSTHHAAVMATSNQMVSGVLQMQPQTSHARQDDNAVIIAHAHNIASAPKLKVSAMVIAAAAFISIWLFALNASQSLAMVAFALVLYGVLALVILHQDRETALRHSAPGVEHHRIEAQTEVQTAAIDAWATVMSKMIDKE